MRAITAFAAKSCYDIPMQRRYDYRRNLPHLARDIVMETCLRGDGHRFELHALVVMPDHVHLALTPRWDECGTLSIPEIMQEIKSVSAHRINKQTGTLDAYGKRNRLTGRSDEKRPWTRRSNT